MPDQSESPQNPVPQPERQIPVVSEEVVYQPQPVQAPVAAAPPSQPPPTEVKKGFSMPPLKFLLFGLGGLVLLGIIIFAIKQFFFSAPKVEETTLSFWGFEEQPVVDPVIREFETANPNVKISYAKQSQADYRERLVNSLAKNAGPDLFYFHNSWIPMLSSYLSPAPQEVMTGESFSNTFYPVAVSDLAPQGTPLGVPLETDGLGLYINETIFNNSGKLVPNNWNDLQGVAFELTTKDETERITQSGVALGQTSNVDHWQDILSLMLLQNKADMANPGGALAGDPLLYFASFSREFKTWDETLPSSTEAFAKGQVAMYFGPAWRANQIKQQNPNLVFRIAPVPQLPKNTPNDPDITLASYQAVGVWTKSKNTQAAWKFLEFMTQKGSLEKLYAGASVRGYGRPYPRRDMATLQEFDAVLGAYIRQATSARSSHLVSDTYDGATGINSKISAIWKIALDQAIKEGRDVEALLLEVAQGVRQVLDSYSTTK